MKPNFVYRFHVLPYDLQAMLQAPIDSAIDLENSALLLKLSHPLHALATAGDANQGGIFQE